MRILLVEPGKTPILKEIDGSLKSMQEIVGGTIQALYPFEEPVALICNDDGKLLGLPLNRGLRDEEGRIYMISWPGHSSYAGRRRTVTHLEVLRMEQCRHSSNGLLSPNCF